MKRRQLLDLADATVEGITRTRSALVAALDALDDTEAEAGAPRARAYDGIVTTGGRSTIWCDRHEREVEQCHRHDLDCCGAPIAVSDPTGEAAIRGVKATKDRAKLERLVRNISDHVSALSGLVERWQPRAPLDPKQERKRARDAEDARRQVAADNESCISCARTEVRPGVRRQEPYHRATTLGGRLDSVTRLCVWCLRFGNDTGRLPTLDELEAHHRGERVRRKA